MQCKDSGVTSWNQYYSCYIQYMLYGWVQNSDTQSSMDHPGGPPLWTSSMDSPTDHPRKSLYFIWDTFCQVFAPELICHRTCICCKKNSLVDTHADSFRHEHLAKHTSYEIFKGVCRGVHGAGLLGWSTRMVHGPEVSILYPPPVILRQLLLLTVGAFPSDIVPALGVHYLVPHPLVDMPCPCSD